MNHQTLLEHCCCWETEQSPPMILCLQDLNASIETAYCLSLCSLDSVSSNRGLDPKLAGCQLAFAGNHTLRVVPSLHAQERRDLGSRKYIRPDLAWVQQILWVFRNLGVRSREATEARESFQIVGCVQKVFLRPAQAETVRPQMMGLTRRQIWPQTANGCRAPVVDQPGRRRIPSSVECSSDTALGDRLQQEGIESSVGDNELMMPVSTTYASHSARFDTAGRDIS